MDLRLSGKTAIVTGASRGIGLAIARGLISEGVRVVGAARETTPELLALDGKLRPVIADLTAADGPAAVVSAAAAAFDGALDILVNNVGAVRPRTDGFGSVTDEDWSATLAVNFLAAVRITRQALPLLADGGGSVITISSVNAVLPDPLVIDYSAAKGALTNFCKALSKEVGPRGVRVNTISPGPVATDLWLGAHGVARTLAGQSGGTPESVAADAVAGTATRRFTTADEVADLALFLASPRAGNITGADFAIDGGLNPTV